MGYDIGAILFAASYEGRLGELLERLQPGAHPVGVAVGIEDATRREFNATAAGVYDARTVVLDESLPYDCSFDPDGRGPLDEPLATLSAEGPVLCLLMDETSMSFAFAYFEGGELRRARKVDPDRIYSDWGEPLPSEAGLPADTHDDSERIMRVTEVFLGRRLDTLIAENEVRLTRYESGGP